MYAYATTRLIFPSRLRQRYPTHVLLTFLVSTLNFLLSTSILPKILILNINPLTILTYTFSMIRIYNQDNEDGILITV